MVHNNFAARKLYKIALGIKKVFDLSLKVNILLGIGLCSKLPRQGVHCEQKSENRIG